MSYATELELALTSAAEGVRLLQPWIADAQRRADATSQKAAGEVVTEADHAVSDLLIQRIAAKFPRDAICSEESAAMDDPARERRWIIDPIDGTRSFIRGRSGFSIMIALAVQGRVVLGVVADPMARETWHAEAGNGVWLDGKPFAPGHARPRLIWSPFARPEGAHPVATGLGLDEIIEIESFGLRAATMARDGAGICGSRPGSPHIWDSAAGIVIVEELGGRVTGYDGKPLVYANAPTIHPQGFVATLGVDHEKACELMREHLPA